MARIAESISRIRNGLKAVREEAFITDRFIYSVLNKYATTLIERENKLNNIFKNSQLFEEIPYLELIECPIVDVCYTEINSGCTIKRSKDKLPKIKSLKFGPAIRNVSSIDKFITLIQTTASRYAKISGSSTFKYNKSKYYWISNDYLYVPNVDWDAVSINAIFDEDISPWLCGEVGESKSCKLMQENEFNVPEHLLSECEQMTRQELLVLAQIPVDASNDKQNIIR